MTRSSPGSSWKFRRRRRITSNAVVRRPPAVVFGRDGRRAGPAGAFGDASSDPKDKAEITITPAQALLTPPRSIRRIRSRHWAPPALVAKPVPAAQATSSWPDEAATPAVPQATQPPAANRRPPVQPPPPAPQTFSASAEQRPEGLHRPPDQFPTLKMTRARPARVPPRKRPEHYRPAGPGSCERAAERRAGTRRRPDSPLEQTGLYRRGEHHPHGAVRRAATSSGSSRS